MKKTIVFGRHFFSKKHNCFIEIEEKIIISRYIIQITFVFVDELGNGSHGIGV